MTITNEMINANGVKLRLRQWHKNQAPAVLLVHGYPDSSHVWDKTAALLAEHYHVIAYDVRGAGESDAPSATEAYTLEHLAADFRAVIDTVSPEQPVHVVAHDWGSIQCWEAVTDPALAQRIASYTTISGPSLDHAGHWIAQRIKSGRPNAIAEVAAQLRNSWYIFGFQLPLLAPTLWKTGLDKLWPRLLQRVEGIADADINPTQRGDGATGVRLYRANMPQRVLAPRERRTTVPVNLIVPTRDKFVAVELLDDLHQWAPRLWRRDIDAGHWLQQSHPELVAEQVRDFVDFIESGASDDEAPRALRRSRVYGPRKRYSGKLAIVTGAGNGIGRETLLALAEQGAEVIAVDINGEALERSVELASLLGAQAHGRQMDVGDAGAWEDFAAWVEAELGAPDIIVNNAGIGMAGRFLDTAAEDWDKILRINVWSVIQGSRLFGGMMQAAGRGGSIVNVASAAAFAPSRTMPAYSTTKAAVRMLSDCMRADLADQGIHVITVCPGVINTGITDRSQFVGLSEAEQRQKRQRASSIYARRNLGPKAVSAGIMQALAQGRDEVLVGAEAYGLNLMGRFAPGLSRRLAQLDMA